MASSSVSQESLDINDDYELNARRTRIRTLRARGAFHKTGDHESETSGDREVWDLNGDESPQSATAQSGNLLASDNLVHDSPSRSSAIQRAKDKRTRPNHLQKGKLPKDKRKLREKRRSTGVVQHHLATNESTGDSLDDDDEEEKVLTEAKRNTTYNEVIDDDNPQTPSDVMRRIQQFQTMNLTTNNKPIPEKNSATRLMAPKGFVARRNKSPSDLEADLEDNQDYDSAVSQSETSFPFSDRSTARDSNHNQNPKPWTNQSKFSSYSATNFKPTISQVDQHSSYGSVPLYQNTIPPRQSSFESDRQTNVHSSQPKSPVSPKSPKSTNQNSSSNYEPIRPVSSVLSRYSGQDKSEETGGYRSRFRDRELGGVRGPVGQQYVASLMNKENKEDDRAKKRMEKDLERERDENRRLQRVLEDKDRRIAELERQVAMLNRDVEDCAEDVEKLQIENRALIQAVGQLSTQSGGSTHV